MLQSLRCVESNVCGNETYSSEYITYTINMLLVFNAHASDLKLQRNACMHALINYSLAF